MVLFKGAARPADFPSTIGALLGLEPHRRVVAERPLGVHFGIIISDCGICSSGRPLLPALRRIAQPCHRALPSRSVASTTLSIGAICSALLATLILLVDGQGTLALAPTLGVDSLQLDQGALRRGGGRIHRSEVLGALALPQRAITGRLLVVHLFEEGLEVFFEVVPRSQGLADRRDRCFLWLIANRFHVIPLLRESLR